jgi:hypothetical protein
LIFLGAGASAPFGIPTSEQLTDEIMKLLAVQHQPLLSDITGFWKKHNQEKDPNYENILTFLMGLTNPRSIPRDSIVQVFINDFPAHQKSYEHIINEMYAKIIDYCTKPFTSLSPNQLEDIFQNTYDAFTIFREQPIFTTNYDPSIEIWCQKRNVQIFDNTIPTENPEVRKRVQITEESLAKDKTQFAPFENLSQSLKIVRLHGSTWTCRTKQGQNIKLTRPKDKLLFTDWYADLDPRPNMIFPGQESALATLDWDVLYQHFKRMLVGSCLVIGYSFQDELINRVFTDNLKTSKLKNIGILSPHPDEVIKNLFWNQEVPPGRIREMPVKFGTEEALEQIFRWLRKEFGISYPEVPRVVLSKINHRMRSYLQ